MPMCGYYDDVAQTFSMTDGGGIAKHVYFLVIQSSVSLGLDAVVAEG